MGGAALSSPTSPLASQDTRHGKEQQKYVAGFCKSISS